MCTYRSPFGISALPKKQTLSANLGEKWTWLTIWVEFPRSGCWEYSGKRLLLGCWEYPIPDLRLMWSLDKGRSEVPPVPTQQIGLLSPTKGRKDNPIGEADVERLSVPAQKRCNSSPEKSGWQDEVEIVSETFSVRSEHKRVRLAPDDRLLREREAVAFRQELEVDVAASRARTRSLRDTLERLENLRQPQPLPLPQPTAVELAGRRDFPDGFPIPASLYWSDVRPQPLPEVLPVHKCTLCQKVKSRPVWFPNCKHSACYVCTFMHLLHHWDCPDCGRTMYTAPRRDNELEEQIRAQYPSWVDRSLSLRLPGILSVSNSSSPQRVARGHFSSLWGLSIAASAPPTSPARRSRRTPHDEPNSATTSRTSWPQLDEYTQLANKESDVLKQAPTRYLTQDTSSPARFHTQLVNQLPWQYPDLVHSASCGRVVSMDGRWLLDQRETIGLEAVKRARRVHEGYTARSRVIKIRHLWGLCGSFRLNFLFGTSTEVPQSTPAQIYPNEVTWFWGFRNATSDCHDPTSFFPTFTTRWGLATNTQQIKSDSTLVGSSVPQLDKNVDFPDVPRIAAESFDTPEKHISRLVLPDLVEDWACAELRQDYEIFGEALQTDFDETESIHWLKPPPFNTEAIALAEDRADYDDYSNYYVSCLVDGCLLRREQRREEAFKQELARVGKKQMVNGCRVELQGLLAGEWADMQGLKGLYQPGTREHTIYERHVIFLGRRMCERMRPTYNQSAPSCHQSDLTLAFTRAGANPSLPADPSLPAGALQYVQNVERTEPFRASLLGRVVGVVQRPREKWQYLILEGVDHAPLQRDFTAFIRALEVVPARYHGLYSKRVNYWCHRGHDDNHGLVYVHLTSNTKLASNSLPLFNIQLTIGRLNTPGTLTGSSPRRRRLMTPHSRPERSCFAWPLTSAALYHQEHLGYAHSSAYGVRL
ncbi:hypothetical protein C8F01DRAFT_1342057 [Mycena amicta]|nr:hypothetical protein C8F01DRAFT_1342057 [Mycena amicta]